MKFYHVVAMANNRVIGKNNQLPWPKLSEDLKHFKATTLDSTVIMGRKTFESLGKKPLPQRENFVLSRRFLSSPNVLIGDPQAQGFPVKASGNDSQNLRFFKSVQDAVKNVKTPKGFIIGGTEIFNQTFDLIDGIYMTRIYENYPGDTFYPELPDFFEPVSSKLLPSALDAPRMEVIYYENVHKVKPGTAIGKME